MNEAFNYIYNSGHAENALQWLILEDKEKASNDLAFFFSFLFLSYEVKVHF